MRKRSGLLAGFVALGAFLLGASALTTSAGEARATAPTLAFENGLWFDGRQFVAQTWYSVDARLTRERPERIDMSVALDGAFVLPGLTEAHNHDLQSPVFAAMASARYVSAGIYRSVQLCGRAPLEADFLEGHRRPGSVEARYVDACISAPDGHPLGIALASMRRAGLEADADEAGQAFDPVADSGAVTDLLDRLRDRGARSIKIMLIQTDRHEALIEDEKTFGYRGLEPSLARLLVREAGLRGLEVLAHVETAADFAFAVDIGADIIAHLPGYRIWEGTTLDDYRITPQDAQKAAGRGVALITTAGAANLVAGPQGASQDLLAMQAENLHTLIRAGVRLAIGSDNPMGTVVDELVHIDALGVMDRADLLRIATSQTAWIMMPGLHYGVFEPGAEASFVAYRHDPLDDLGVLRRPDIRVHQGVVLAEDTTPDGGR